MREVNGLPGRSHVLLLGLGLISEGISFSVPVIQNGRVRCRLVGHEVTEVAEVDFFVALEIPPDSVLHGVQLLVTVHLVHVASCLLIVVRILNLLKGVLAEEFYAGL